MITDAQAITYLALGIWGIIGIVVFLSHFLQKIDPEGHNKMSKELGRKWTIFAFLCGPFVWLLCIACFIAFLISIPFVWIWETVNAKIDKWLTEPKQNEPITIILKRDI